MRKQAKATTTTPATTAGSTVKFTLEPGQTNALAVTESVVTGTLVNSALTKRFTSVLSDGMLDLTEFMKVIMNTIGEVQAGDLRTGEALLTGQAVALNAIFSELARRAALNMGEHMSATEAYMRLALKAQGQCRATIETLAAMKNPPVVFARQANINNGGQQQVNNGAVSPPREQATHTEQTVFKPNELLEDATHGRTQLDTRATPAAGRAHQDLAAVGAINRATNR